MLGFAREKFIWPKRFLEQLEIFLRGKLYDATTINFKNFTIQMSSMYSVTFIENRAF